MNFKKVFVFGIAFSQLALCYGLEEKSKMTLRTDVAKIKYNPMIFGHFIEHFDDQIYGGFLILRQDFRMKKAFGRMLSML